MANDRRGPRSARKTRRKEPVEMITTTIALDAETHRHLRHLAVDEGTSFRDLIREAIDTLLVSRAKKERK